MSKLSILLCLVGLVCFADAMTKKELSTLIHHVSNTIRQEHIPQIKSTIKEALLEATTPEERTCVNGHVSSTYRDLNMSIGLVLNGMRSDYETKSSEELEATTEEQERENIETRVRASLKWFPERMKQIKQCSSD